MSFLQPDRWWRRLLFGYLAGVIWLGSMWALWAMPPCLTTIGGRYRTTPHGLIAPTEASERYWAAQPNRISINRWSFLSTMIFSAIVSHYCILRYRAWLAGRRLRYVEDALNSAILERLFSLQLFADRRARRSRRGLCPECGYDLRGDLTMGCPECGWGRTDR